ncbi:MAG: hypothetical protein AB1898_29915 [Acidobacteriota bacterium]
MIILRAVSRWPFTTAALLSLSMVLIAWICQASYDDNGLGSIIFLLAPLVGVIYFLPEEVLYPYLRDIPQPYYILLSASTGLLLSAGLDLVLQVTCRILSGRPFRQDESE